jgi:chromosome segregation ATPase
MVVLARKDTAERILSLIPDLERLDWRQAVSMDAAVGELSAVANAVADIRNVVERQGEAMQAGIAGPAVRAELLEQIRTLTAQIEKSEADRADRLTIIHALTARLEESEGDRAARLTIIHTLTARLEESEANRATLWEQIRTLTARIEESEADRATLWEQIRTLTARIEESEADRADLFAQKEKLRRRNLFRRIRNA